MRKILITTDFTPEAMKNIELVLDVLKSTDRKSSLILLNTYLVPSADPKRVIELNDQLKKISRDGLARAEEAALALNQNPHVTIETASHMGSLFNVVHNILGHERFESVSFCEAGPDKVAELVNGSDRPLVITCR